MHARLNPVLIGGTDPRRSRLQFRTIRDFAPATGWVAEPSRSRDSMTASGALAGFKIFRLRAEPTQPLVGRRGHSAGVAREVRLTGPTSPKRWSPLGRRGLCRTRFRGDQRGEALLPRRIENTDAAFRMPPLNGRPLLSEEIEVLNGNRRPMRCAPPCGRLRHRTFGSERQPQSSA